MITARSAPWAARHCAYRANITVLTPAPNSRTAAGRSVCSFSHSASMLATSSAQVPSSSFAKIRAKSGSLSAPPVPRKVSIGGTSASGAVQVGARGKRNLTIFRPDRRGGAREAGVGRQTHHLHERRAKVEWAESQERFQFDQCRVYLWRRPRQQLFIAGDPLRLAPFPDRFVNVLH